MEWWQLVIYACASIVMSTISGVAGAGGGFIMTPLMIFLGLTPAEAVSTGKFGGLMVALGSLGGMRSAHGTVHWRRIVPVMVLALLVGLVVPFAIKTLDHEVYRVTLGIILLLMVPVVLLKKIGITPHKPSTAKKYLGGVLLALALGLQGIFSGGIGTLVNVVLMGMLGMTAIEANITKRWAQLILNVAIILGVVFSGLVVWQIVAVSAFTTFTGSYIGGRLAVKKGNAFVMDVMVALMVVSALALIFGVG